MEWSVRKATEDDVRHIAPRLREADKKELMASCGEDPEKHLLDSLKLPSMGTWVGVKNDKPEIIFGVVQSACREIGFPWMVCTDELKKSPREFIIKCKRWVEGFSKNYPLLLNFVHAENELHIRWLKWCGFEFIELHEEYGVGKEPFWEFRMYRKE